MALEADAIPGARMHPDLQATRVVVVACQPLEGEALATLLRVGAGADAVWVDTPLRVRPLLPGDGPGVVLWVTRDVGREDVAEFFDALGARPAGVVLLVDGIDREALTELVAGGAANFAVVRRSATPTLDDAVLAIAEVCSGRSSFDPALLSAVLAPDERSAVAGLTDAEREVADLVARGLRNRTIGKRLHKSERTVEKHVANVFDKLGLCAQVHPHLDRRVATARMVLADKAGEPLCPDTLDGTPL